MKSICIIMAGLTGGGIEKIGTSLANHYLSLGYRTSVILIFKTNHFFSLRDGIRVFEPEIDRKEYNRFVYAIKMIPHIRNAVKLMHPDCILSLGEWFNPYVILSTRGLHIPVYVSDRMSPQLNLGVFWELVKRYTYKYADGIIAQTSLAKKIIYKKTHNSNIKVIFNPLSAVDYDGSPKQNLFVSIGRLSIEKGHIVLLKAFNMIVNKIDWDLSIVGDGPERPLLEDFVLKNNLSKRVTFYGHRKNIQKYLSQASVFVLPSLSEGFPNALIEAMSVPLPCIASDCIAGPGDIIQNEINGILVPPNDVNILADKMLELANSEARRRFLAENAYKIRLKLPFHLIAQEYLDFILGKSKCCN